MNNKKISKKVFIDNSNYRYYIQGQIYKIMHFM